MTRTTARSATRTALALGGLAALLLGGCVGAPGPVAQRGEPGARVVRVPTALTGLDGRTSTLILGVQ